MNPIFDNHSKVAASKVRKSFKTTDLALTMALMVIVFSVSGGIVSEAFQDSRSSLAMSEVEHLAFELSQYPEVLNKNSRGPASEQAKAEISQDPWGAPYHYKILKDDKGGMKVIVVSAGPNKKLESDLDHIELKTHVFGGDDIGFVYDGSNKKTE